MNVDANTVIMSLLGFVTTGITIWVNNIWATIKGQQELILALNVKLAENYAPRAELNAMFERVFDKLDEIQRDVRTNQRETRVR